MSASTAPARHRPAPLRITLTIAILWAAASAAVTLYTILVDLLSTSIPSPVDVAPFWPKVNPTMKLDGISGAVTGGGYDHATFMISGLGLDARLWYAAEALVEGLAVVTIALTIALLCSRVLRGDPFDAIVPRAFTVSGIAVLVGGFLGQIFGQIAGFHVIEETFRAVSAEWTISAPGATESSVTWPSGSENFGVSSWPLGIALGLFAIAVVFRYGARISRERAALAQEVDGLV
jgi:hypothetical protein